MKIAVYGAGYVGLVSAACLAKLGHLVICADIDEQRITMLSKGECPIYEEQLPELLQEQSARGHLQFSTNVAFACKQSEVHIIATGTPSLPDGSADLSQVFAVALKIANEIERDGILVTKSTVSVGTGDAIQIYVDKELERQGKKFNIAVCSNPEFLREGTAVSDFLNADRIILGGEPEALSILKEVYQPLAEKGLPILGMSRLSAELVKYSANAMLACRISFMNQISRLADKVGANIDEIKQGIGLDPRIGPFFLNAGIGYGGSCFPKDVRALAQTAKLHGVDTSLLDAIDSVNQLQKNWVFEQLNQHFNNELAGLTIGLWGLAFKPGTDDMREASSLVAIDALLQAGAKLRVFDPVAMPVARKIMSNDLDISWCDSSESVFEQDLHALVIITEWPVFKNYPLARLKNKLGTAPLIDGRNCFALTQVVAAKLHYYSVGRPPIISSHS